MLPAIIATMVMSMFLVGFRAGRESGSGLFLGQFFNFDSKKTYLPGNDFKAT